MKINVQKLKEINKNNKMINCFDIHYSISQPSVNLFLNQKVTIET